MDFLNGGIVRFGSEHGVPTPLNEAIWALIRGLEGSFTTHESDQQHAGEEAG
ncbi:MAG: ketopantoate reductase C-terminal domain-containing protein [Solirubrobacteraceae bacterium]